jgi:hypothetical protein
MTYVAQGPPPMGTRHRYQAYCLILMASAVILLASVWAWVLLKPMAYLDGAYPQWMQRDIWLRTCDLGQLVVLGDSRAEAAIIPRALPVSAMNFAGPGGGPLETSYIAERIVRCPNRLVQIGQTWDLSIRNGFLPFQVVQAIRRTGDTLGDSSLDDAPSVDTLPHVLRPWAYRLRFPPIFLGSLIKGVLQNREARNLVILARTLEDRGYLLFDEQPRWDGVAEDADVRSFRPLPVLNAYLERTVATLQAAGIEIDLAITPVNDATQAAMPVPVRQDYVTYLESLAARYPASHLLDHGIPAWPAAYFSDPGLHLNAFGAAVLSRQYAACLQSAPVQGPQCRLGQRPPDNPSTVKHSD